MLTENANVLRDEIPLYQDSANSAAKIPGSYEVHEEEFEIPFIPMHYGVAISPHHLKSRSWSTKWFRRILAEIGHENDHPASENSTEYCTALFVPRSTPAGLAAQSNWYKPLWMDDILESMADEEGRSGR